MTEIPAALKAKADLYRQLNGLSEEAVIAKASREYPKLPFEEAMAKLLENVNTGATWERG